MERLFQKYVDSVSQLKKMDKVMLPIIFALEIKKMQIDCINVIKSRKISGQKCKKCSLSWENML